jgi:hypothetical protein
MDAHLREIARAAFTVVAGCLISSNGSAQTVLVPGGEATLGLDGTVDKFYKAANTVIVKTEDGVRHVVHVQSGTKVHGTGETADDPFAGLTEGSHVAVHYVMRDDRKNALEIDRVGSEGLSVLDGNVVAIDRKTGRLSVELDNGRRATLSLTEHATNDGGIDLTTNANVIVFYSTDGSGDLVAHYFKKK